MTQDSDKETIRTVVQALHAALRVGTASAVIANYSPGAMVFELAPPLSHRIDEHGIAAWLGTWKGPVDRESRELGIEVSGDLAVWFGYFRTSATTLAGEHAVWWERATLTLRRREGQWSIVHEHTSVPFYMDGSLRAALDLRP